MRTLAELRALAEQARIDAMLFEATLSNTQLVARNTAAPKLLRNAADAIDALVEVAEAAQEHIQFARCAAVRLRVALAGLGITAEETSR